MSPEIAARLAACNIQLAAEAQDYSVFMRENCVALVRRAGDGYGDPGSSGLMTENGLAYLVWRDGLPRLVAKGNEVAAGDHQVEALRRFSQDLQRALG